MSIDPAAFFRAFGLGGASPQLPPLQTPRIPLPALDMQPLPGVGQIGLPPVSLTTPDVFTQAVMRPSGGGALDLATYQQPYFAPVEQGNPDQFFGPPTQKTAPNRPPVGQPTAYGESAVGAAIDAQTQDPHIRLAMRMAALMEGGSLDGDWGTGDNGQSHGPYQIYQAAHGQHISVADSLDPTKATAYMLPYFQQAAARVDPGLWESDPARAAALTAYYAERPAKMYDESRWRSAYQAVQQRQQQAPAQRHTSWDYLVPGGQGHVETGGTHGGHPAIDIFAPAGTPIYAPVDGVSSPATYSLGGNATTLQGADGRWYYFAHAMKPMAGGRVRKGQIIGYVGNTGNARNTPSHLHYAVASDPRYFDMWNGSGDLDPSMA